MADSIEITLEQMAHGGKALGRHQGRVVFVPYAIPGERVRARITEDKERHAFAELVEVLEPSPARVDPPCPHFGSGLCGGCQWQHIAYEQQLIYKRDVLLDQLKRIGKFEDPVVHPVQPASYPWHYRFYATFTCALSDGHTGECHHLGFWNEDNSRIVPVDTCLVLHADLLDIYESLDMTTAQIERVKFQVGTDPADRMIILYTKDDQAPEIKTDLPISVNLLLSDNEPMNLIGDTHVHYDVLGRDFRVTAGSFFQVNPEVAGMLVETVLSSLELQGNETILDLYSGVGLFTAFIAEHAALVMSVESYPPAVTDAEENLAHLENVDLIEGAVEAVLDDLEGSFDGVVVDPPRTGLAVEVIDALARLAPPGLVYVSCDPATLARDAGRLARHGYTLVEVHPLDMFPQTFHIESVALLRHEAG